jgi:hypothetical protein
MPRLDLPGLDPAEAEEGTDAIAEAAALASGTDLSDVQALSRIRRLIRSDTVDSHVHGVLICGLWITAFAVGCMFLVLVWNQSTPTSWRFLTPEQESELYKFLFSGAVGGGVTTIARRLGEKSKSDT